MDWFKHLTATHEDPDIMEAEDRFGDAGYNVFCKMLEVYGREYSSLDGAGFLNISWTILRRKLRKNRKTLEEILGYFQEINRFDLEISEKRLSIRIPKFEELASNWTKRAKAAPTEATTEGPTASELEEELEEEKKIEPTNVGLSAGPTGDGLGRSDSVTSETGLFGGNGNGSKPETARTQIPVCPYEEIIAIFHEMLPDLPRVRVWEGQRKRSLAARWREDPKRRNLDWWREYFRLVKAQPVLLGQNSRGWRADLEFLCKADKIGRVLEGYYGAGKKSHSGGFEQYADF